MERNIVKPGWPMPRPLKEKFVKFADDVDGKVQGECAGAIWLWMQMPPIVRELAKLEAKGISITADGWWESFARKLAESMNGLRFVPDDK